MLALSKELMALEVLNPMSPEAFREEFLAVLDKYFVQIAKTAGASGRPVPKSFRRSFDSAEAAAAGALPSADAAAEAPAAAAQQPPAQGLPEPAPAVAPAPVKGKGSKGKA